jgi:hypothetical protein
MTYHAAFSQALGFPTIAPTLTTSLWYTKAEALEAEAEALDKEEAELATLVRPAVQS